MIFFVSNFLTLASVCWARYIEDRDMKAITSKSFVLMNSSFALRQWRKRSLQILDQIPNLTFLTRSLKLGGDFTLRLFVISSFAMCSLS